MKASHHPKKKIEPIHRPEDLGLDVLSGDDDLFRWFLLAYLLGKPIQSSVALRTWRLFVDRNVDIPWTIVSRSDHQLVGILHAGGYTRYQHVMTSALKRCMEQLIADYEGSLTLMLADSKDEEELSKRLQKLYGVGPKTAEIFMRETEEYFARKNE